LGAINGKNSLAKKLPSIVKEIRNNPPPPVNYAYQKNISYSQMSIFRGCPHRWKLQYKDKIKRFTSSIHTVFGTAVHEAMQHYLDVAYEKSFAAADKEINIEGVYASEDGSSYARGSIKGSIDDKKTLARTLALKLKAEVEKKSKETKEVISNET